MPAPALSPVVGGGRLPSNVLEWLPAFGSPLLVPPVRFVYGGRAWSMSSEDTAPSTFICCPAPWLPSYPVVFHHLKPQARPVASPVHVARAASVELRRTGRIMSRVKGAIWV